MRVIDSRVLDIDELKLERFTQGNSFGSGAYGGGRRRTDEA
jgi:hypothetical protein